VTHTLHEVDDITEAIPDHPARADSPQYLRTRPMMVRAATLAHDAGTLGYGPPPYEDHHGGAAWVLDGQTPRVFLNPFGIEWSGQFACDPKLVDAYCRVPAESLVAHYPGTEAWYTGKLGMRGDDLAVLHTPIVTADQLSRFVDSLWNASVPLPKSLHVGMPPKADPGYHHGPKPLVDLRCLVRPDFVLFLRDGTAVAPTHPRGSGVSTVVVLHAPPGSRYRTLHKKAKRAGDNLVLSGRSTAAKEAFARQ